MRLTRFHSFLLIGGSIMLVGPAIGLSQPGPPGGFQGGQPGGFQPGGGFPGGAPGGFQRGGQGGFTGGGRGNRGGGGGRQFDPNMIFNMLSGGQDYIDVQKYLPLAQMRDPNAADKINDFMQRMGITNGQLTRDQFAQFMQERMSQRQAQRGPGGPNGQNPADPNNPAAANPNDLTDDDEPPPPEDKRSVVYRASSLPQGMPAWFATYDTDHDGQVGLYEWKAAGGTVSAFEQIDLNGDGFITIEEALTYQEAQGGPVVASAGFNGGPSYGSPSYGQPNGLNGGGRGNRGNRGGGFNGGGRGNRGGGNNGGGRGNRGGGQSQYGQ